jgi:hypothetical protein
VTFLVMSVLALLGALAAFVTYGFAETYADPTASAAENLVSSVSFLGFALAVLIAVALGAVSISKGSLRRPVVALSVALVVASALGIVAGNHYGFKAKQNASSVPPRCGIGHAELNATWQSLDHEGYFAGSEDSASHCSHHVTARDLSATLRHYEEQLVARGWTVSRSTTRRVEATGEGYRFEAAIIDSESGQSAPTLSVTMRER